jgi:metallo-beta-lactamase family protein
MIRLTFHGAAETVTGSKYLLEADGARVLVDCGLFQGLKPLRALNWKPLPFPASSVQAVVLTHAHIDHVGYLPRFVRDGFRGPVWCTPATADLAAIMLFDAAKNQQEDADFANKEGFSKHKPALPLYEPEDVARALKLLKTVEREEWFSPAAPIFMRYHIAGHLLGASSIEVEIRTGAKPTRIVFSGDVGRYDAPLYFDPLQPPACDYLICESTYGNREHPDIPVLDELATTVNAAVARGGVMLVPAFAVGRSQQLIYLLRLSMQQKRIPTMPVYLDSPMAMDATNIYCRYVAEHDLTEGQLVGSGCVFDGPNIFETRTVAESKKINDVKGPAIIIASNGMLTGGRILHQLEQRLGHPENTIVLAGFMAEGTRGRALEDGAKFLRLYGHDVPVRAAVVSISSLSGHAGHKELIRWLSPLSPPKQTFITHGEFPAATALADELRTTKGWNTTVPKLGQAFELAETES